MTTTRHRFSTRFRALLIHSPTRPLKLLPGLPIVILLLFALPAHAIAIYSVAVSSQLSSSLRDPRVKGAVFYVPWKQIEPADGVFEWTKLDAEVAQVSKVKKTFKLDLQAGVLTPAWVYAEGAQTFQFVWSPLQLGPPTYPSLCETVSMPLPWDPIYEAKFIAAIAALGVHFSQNSALVGLKLTGVSFVHRRNLLPVHPAATPVLNAFGSTMCTTFAEVPQWNQAGYSFDKVADAFYRFDTAFVAAFPNIELSAEYVAGFY